MRIVNKTGAAAALALFVSMGQGVAQDVSGNTVLATVGGVNITLGHLITARETLPDQYRQLPDDVLFEGLLDQIIQQNALAQSLPADLGSAAQKGLDNQISGFLAGVAIREATVAAVTDEALQSAYAAQYAGVPQGTEYNASHILVETQEEAASLKAQADAGADFAELARDHSTGPSGPNGGALGWFGEGMMVPPFEAAVKELAVGGVSGPVQTQFGWHVVKLNDSRAAEAPPFEQVRAELFSALSQAAAEDAVAAAVAAVDVERSDVEIDPALLRDSSLLED